METPSSLHNPATLNQQLSALRLIDMLKHFFREDHIEDFISEGKWTGQITPSIRPRVNVDVQHFWD